MKQIHSKFRHAYTLYVYVTFEYFEQTKFFKTKF